VVARDMGRLVSVGAGAFRLLLNVDVWEGRVRTNGSSAARRRSRDSRIFVRSVRGAVCHGARDGTIPSRSSCASEIENAPAPTIQGRPMPRATTAAVTALTADRPSECPWRRPCREYRPAWSPCGPESPGSWRTFRRRLRRRRRRGPPRRRERASIPWSGFTSF